MRTLMLELSCASRLVFELLAQLVQQLREAAVGGRHHSTMCVVHGGSHNKQAVRLILYYQATRSGIAAARDEVQAKGNRKGPARGCQCCRITARRAGRDQTGRSLLRR